MKQPARLSVAFRIEPFQLMHKRRESCKFNRIREYYLELEGTQKDQVQLPAPHRITPNPTSVSESFLNSSRLGGVTTAFRNFL